jgi:predicted DNA-binding transcriptional regulator YafY
MRARYIQIEILMCLLDCNLHTISEIRNETGYSVSTIRRHIQDLSIYLPIEIHRGSRNGMQGGGGVILHRNFLLKILFAKEIKLILHSLELNSGNEQSIRLKDKLERMLGNE